MSPASIAALTAALAAAAAPASGIRIEIDHPYPGEAQELRQLLAVPAGTQLDDAALATLERRLLETGRYLAAVCRRAPGAAGTDATCAVSTARVIRRVRLEGVPFRILRSDLEKRIFIRPGQRADLKVEDGESRIARQRQRVADFLVREGFFGAEVEVLTEVDPGDPRAADLVVRIEGGETVQVRDVQIQGAGPLSREEIEKGLRPGLLGTFSPMWLRERTDALVRRLREERGYPEAHVSARYQLDLEARAVDLRVRLLAGPYLSVFFSGDVGNDEAALREQLTFAVAGTADQTEVEVSRRALRRWLQMRGYPAARVDAEREEPDSDRVVVRYHLVRGPAAAVDEVVVHGPPGFDVAGLLRKVDLVTEPRSPTGTRGVAMLLLEMAPDPLLRWLSLDAVGRVVDDQLEADRQRLEKAVVDRGFPEGAVTARVERVGPDALRVVYRIEPGAGFQLKKIVCDGNASVPCGDIQKALVHRVGGPFMLDAFDVERGRVLGLYAQRGFPYASAEVLADFDDRGRPVLRVVVVEGQRARLSALLVEGNLDTRRSVIGRELAVDADKPLDPVAIDAGVRRLRRTGLFARVNSRYLGLEEQRQDLAYQVSVEERRSLTLDSAVNFSTSELFGIEAELRERNLLGLAVDARAAGRFGLVIGRRTYLRGSLGWPRIWGSPLGLTLSSGFDVSDRPVSPKPLAENLAGWVENIESFQVEGTLFNEDVQRTQVFSNKLKLDLPITAAIRLLSFYEIGVEWRDGLNRVGVEVQDNVAWVDASQPITITGGIPISAISSRLEYRQLDNPFDPRRGIQLQAGAKLGLRHFGAALLAQGARAIGFKDLEAKSDFTVVSGGAQAYHTEGRITLASSLRTAVGFPISPETQEDPRRYIPHNDLIVAGGDRSVRGHGTSPSIGIQDVLRDSEGNIVYQCALEEVDPQTGEQICGKRVKQPVTNPGLIGVVANLELRTLVARDLWIGDLQWAVFADGAYVADQLPDTEDLLASLDAAHLGRHLGFGVGTGLRYVTPVGPIILDLAVDPLRIPNGSVHFTFGYAF